MNEISKGTFAQLNSDGMLETVDENTGKIVAVEKRPQMPHDEKHIFSEQWAGIICQMHTEGKGLLEIAAMPGMPEYYTILRWQDKFPEFEKALRKAFKMRSFYHFEKAIEVAKEAKTDKGNKDSKAEYEAHKWAAEKTNPETFGPRTKIDGVGGQATTTVIITGVPQQADSRDVTEKNIEVEATQKDETEVGLLNDSSATAANEDAGSGSAADAGHSKENK